ncbi:uncharacterized protein [Musca autumnalis]|uniref:uncharacterized protein n=1 Tax=Musca autumnalis TaxID=221902 RepID=UPI003CED6629
MFSLVKFENDDFYVVQSKDVKQNLDKCVVKYKGCSYSADFIKSDDNRENLEEEAKKEKLMSLISVPVNETQRTGKVSQFLYMQNISPSTMEGLRDAIRENLICAKYPNNDNEILVSLDDKTNSTSATYKHEMSSWNSSSKDSSNGQLDLLSLYKFSLVTYNGDDLCVINSNSIKQINGKRCVVQSRGGRYSAELISTSNDKSQLLGQKQKNELLRQSEIIKNIELQRENIECLSKCQQSSTLESKSEPRTGLNVTSSPPSNTLKSNEKSKSNEKQFECRTAANRSSNQTIITTQPEDLQPKSVMSNNKAKLKKKQKRYKTNSNSSSQASCSIIQTLPTQSEYTESALHDSSKEQSDHFLNLTVEILQSGNQWEYSSEHEPESPIWENFTISPAKLDIDQSANAFHGVSEDPLVEKTQQEDGETVSHARISFPYSNDQVILQESGGISDKSPQGEIIISPAKLDVYSSADALHSVVQQESMSTSDDNPQGEFSGSNRFEELSWEVLNPANRLDSLKNSTTIESFGNLTDKNTIDSTEQSISEYIPSDLSKTNNTIVSSHLEDLRTRVNVETLTVPLSTQKSKQHYCMFCNTLQCKIARHFFLKHKNEKMVKMAMALPRKNRERREILEKLRKQGDFQHNTGNDVNTGTLIVTRRQIHNANHKADYYICCATCKGFYGKSAARAHIRKCSKKKNSRNNLIYGRKCTQYIHEAANTEMRTNIFPVLRNDKIR